MYRKKEKPHSKRIGILLLIKLQKTIKKNPKKTLMKINIQTFITVFRNGISKIEVKCILKKSPLQKNMEMKNLSMNCESFS